MSGRSVTAIFANTRAVLCTAELGLEDLSGDDPKRRLSGLHNVVVFGRAVTNVLQGLRSPLGDEFNEWYETKQAEMGKDVLLKRFYKMRSEIIKEGEARTHTTIQIGHLDTRELQPLQANPPPGASAFFIGDHLGGSGWEVELPDGSTTKYYVTLPSDLDIEITFNLDQTIRRHQGSRPKDQSAAGLSRLYIDYLRKLVTEAEGRFG